MLSRNYLRHLPSHNQPPHLKRRESTNGTEESGVHHKSPLEIFIRFQLSRKLDRVNLDFLHGNAHNSSSATFTARSFVAGGKVKTGEVGHTPDTKSAVILLCSSSCVFLTRASLPLGWCWLYYTFTTKLGGTRSYVLVHATTPKF